MAHNDLVTIQVTEGDVALLVGSCDAMLASLDEAESVTVDEVGATFEERAALNRLVVGYRKLRLYLNDCVD